MCQCCRSIQLFYFILSIFHVSTVMMPITINITVVYQVMLEVWELGWHHFRYSWPSVNLPVPLDQLHYQARLTANFVPHVMSMTAAHASDVANVALLP